MPRMDRTGPEGKGTRTGRGLGRCKKVSDEEALQNLGKGQALRRKVGGGQGLGKRLKSSE